MAFDDDSTVPLHGSVDPADFLGAGDLNLQYIQELFQARIVLRDNELRIASCQQYPDKLAAFLRECVNAVRLNGKLDREDLEIIRQAMLLDGSPQYEQLATILQTPKCQIRCKTHGQEELYQLSRRKDITFAIGPAGTGKTYLAVAIALQHLLNREVERVILSRPAVEAGENLGYLPGDLKMKIDPYLRPLYDSLFDMLEGTRMKRLLDGDIIEICPLGYMRGRTLNNAFIILDEAQNTTSNQMKMFLTRLGVGSHAIITGDVTQVDLPVQTRSGLLAAREICGDIEGIGFVTLGREDVVRHRLVRDIIDAYEQNDGKSNGLD
ncbi:MAG: PhoH family protein [Candidatus Delongbacteria bacterium]|nr:PhoH family protein [Candidatus Delongbacteria bacterium]